MPGPPKEKGSASEGTPGRDHVSHSDSDQTHEEILAYWTPERMAAAKPREIVLPEDAPSSAVTTGEDADTGENADTAPDPS